MSEEPNPTHESTYRKILQTDPADWEARKRLARLLYDRGDFQEAADLIWATDEIPSIDVELAYAARVLAKAAPRKAIRLLSALLEHNKGKAVQNLGMANALLHHGMVLQAARFYGAALEADPTLGNPDLEHFILWTDDEETLWGDFKQRRPKLGELPWMKRDPQEAMKLTSRITTHTTPVQLPTLPPASGEELSNELYQQKAEKGAEPSPPPAVTIPLDRVDPKHRLFDDELGAPTTSGPAETSAPEKEPAPEQPAAESTAKRDLPGKTAAPAPKIPSFRAPDVAKPPAPPAPPVPAGGPKTRTLQFAPAEPAKTKRPALPPLKKPDAAK